MPAPRPQFTLDDARTHVQDHVFGTASSAPLPDEVARRSVGIELEWLTGYRSSAQRLGLDQATALIADLGLLPGGSRITIEPGGQLELSSARFEGHSLSNATSISPNTLSIISSTLRLGFGCS